MPTKQTSIKDFIFFILFVILGIVCLTGAGLAFLDDNYFTSIVRFILFVISVEYASKELDRFER